jgi:phosphoenolpyruvate phosphomutase
MKEYQKFDYKVPAIAVPSSYNQFKEEELSEAGFNVVIYANHLLRSAFPAMKKTAESILMNKRSLEADEYCMSIKDILEILPN